MVLGNSWEKYKQMVMGIRISSNLKDNCGTKKGSFKHFLKSCLLKPYLVRLISILIYGTYSSKIFKIIPSLLKIYLSAFPHFSPFSFCLWWFCFLLTYWTKSLAMAFLFILWTNTGNVKQKVLPRMQRPSVQFSDSWLRPSQNLPPFLGGGAVHSRIRKCSHAGLQTDHSLHTSQLPSTSRGRKRNHH